ncbi:MAG: ComF family protein [Alphaproteobacteria bacterium]|nr:ComF family protein [Alphaproteobacteria bacterium]
MKRLLQNIVNLFLPPRCLLCGKILSEHNGLCSQCFQKIQFVSEPHCVRCGHPFLNESEVFEAEHQLCGNCLREKRPLFKLRRFAFVYDDFSKNLILGFKFMDKTLFAETLANMLRRAGADILAQKPDLLIPVPIHRRRLLERRYNQSALLVKYLSAQTGVKTEYSALMRVRHTIPQVQLSGSARRHNLQHAFAVTNVNAIKNRKIILVDDVETTGSTLKECAKVLKKAGAKEIYALTLARTVK